MATRTRAPGITFAVQQVKWATTPLPTCKTLEALNRLLDRPAEACCDYTSDCIQQVTFHPLLAAAHFAFSFGGAFRFRPLGAVEFVEGVRARRPDDYPDYLSGWDTGPGARFCDLADGSFVVIELRHTYERGWKVARVGPARGEVSPVVAWSFREFLEGALGSGGRLDWPRPAG